MSTQIEEAAGRKLSYLLAIREALQEEMRRDPAVFLLGEDVARHGGGFGVTKELWEEFGSDRVRNTPISENGFVGVALGAAITGCRPVVEIMFMDFSALAMDQICNEAAKVHYMFGGQAMAPLVIRLPQGGLVMEERRCPPFAKSGGLVRAHSRTSRWFFHPLPTTPRD